MDLPELWKRHQNAPFPSAAVGLTVGDVKLVRLDAEVGAVLTASLRTDGIPRALSAARTMALSAGLDLVRKALREAPLDPETREYFGRLETLALAVLALKG
jgi:hypothetical protein